MKNFMRALLALLLVLAMVLCFVACKDEEKTTPTQATQEDGEIAAQGFWKTATYRKDVTVGEGSKTVKIDVEIDGKSITITLKTNEANLGAALYEAELTNDSSFFDTLNGIELDWNTHKAYWAFYEGETYMQIGVADEAISGGEHYRFVYTK